MNSEHVNIATGELVQGRVGKDGRLRVQRVLVEIDPATVQECTRTHLRHALIGCGIDRHVARGYLIELIEMAKASEARTHQHDLDGGFVRCTVLADGRYKWEANAGLLANAA